MHRGQNRAVKTSGLKIKISIIQFSLECILKQDMGMIGNTKLIVFKGQSYAPDDSVGV